jgi:hypothetical protein
MATNALRRTHFKQTPRPHYTICSRPNRARLAQEIIYGLSGCTLYHSQSDRTQANHL